MLMFAANSFVATCITYEEGVPITVLIRPVNFGYMLALLCPNWRTFSLLVRNHGALRERAPLV
jgi:hypothetical protein